MCEPSTALFTSITSTPTAIPEPSLSPEHRKIYRDVDNQIKGNCNILYATWWTIPNGFVDREKQKKY